MNNAKRNSTCLNQNNIHQKYNLLDPDNPYVVVSPFAFRENLMACDPYLHSVTP